MNQYEGMTQTGAHVNSICDLRSDTVTKPDVGMRAAMAEADVGDDVYGEDPTVSQLENVLAAKFGKEAGLFLPSGTQSNLAALMAHCGRGEEIIVGNSYHVFSHEAAGTSVLGGISLCPVMTEPGGEISPDTILSAIKADDPHYPQNRLLSLENTVGGKAITLDKMRVASDTARNAGLSVHLDGARIFNAITALECEPNELADIADTVSICLSKGLGAPAGTVLVGSQELIAKAYRNRKILGGAMRQSGILAAAGLYALDNHLEGLLDDQTRATKLANALREMNAGSVDNDTNMVFLTPPPEKRNELQARLKEDGIIFGQPSPSVRLVLHRDIDDNALDHAIAAFRRYFA